MLELELLCSKTLMLLVTLEYWHGDGDNIYITPFDVRPVNGYNYNYGSYDVNKFQDNGAVVRYEHYDMLIPVFS